MVHYRNIVIYFIGKLAPAFSSLIIIYLGLHYLGKSEFGKYNLIFSSATIVSTFAIGWIQQSMLRFNSGDFNTIDSQKQFAILTFIASFCGFICLLLIGFFYFRLGIYDCLLVSLFTLVFCIFSVGLTGYQSRLESARYAISESFYYLVSIIVALILILVYNKIEFRVLFISMLIAGSATIALFQGKSVTAYFKSNANRSKDFFRKTFNYGFPVAFWLLISGMFNVADRFIIKEFIGFKDLGVYSSVYDVIYKVCSFLCMPILLSIHPAITKAWNENDKRSAKKLVKKALILELVIFGIAILVFLFLSNFIFNVIFGLNEEGLPSLVFPILLSAMLWQMALFIHKPLELMLLQRHMIVGVIISLVANILLNVILIPKYGYIIAAYTTLLSTVIYISYVILVNKITVRKGHE
jgi:O-antigen/teichoic acid export membrane protein